MSTKITLNVSSQTKAETAVAFIATKTGKSQKKELVVKGVTKAIAGKLAALTSDDFAATLGQQLVYRDIGLDGFKNLIVVGLGDAGGVTAESLRRAAGAVTRDAQIKSTSLCSFVENLCAYTRDKAEALEAAVEGAVMGAYRFDELKNLNKKSEKKSEPTEFTLVAKNKSEQALAKKSLDRGLVIGEAVNFARRLGDLPGNLLTPAVLAKEAADAAKGTKLKVVTWDRARIEKEKMGNLVGVAKGSEEPCKFITMEYRGGTAKAKPLCYVGKGLTFDSGGISIKPSAGMEEMKYDMCGGAGVIAAMVAIAKLKLKVNAIAFVPATENMPGGHANKPGDVTTARNGKTTEVNNTDAEGRLILSDALVYASEQKPAFIVDAATLTGAMSIALGDTHTGFFSNDTKLTKASVAAATKAGEALWEMPLTKDHVDDMKGTYADLSNISSNKGAGSAKGAAYLQEFVGEGIPWAHFDIAGTAWHTGHRLNYNPKKGASGVIVRTFVRLAEVWK